MQVEENEKENELDNRLLARKSKMTRARALRRHSKGNVSFSLRG